MAKIYANVKHIIDNIHQINGIMDSYDKQWSLVVKALGGEPELLSRIIKEPVIKEIHSVSSSHWQEIQSIKSIDRNIKTISIKPSVDDCAKQVVDYADVSLDSAIESIRHLNKWAKKIGKVHQIIVMIELGDLREGLKREGLIPFYDNIASLSNVSLIGIGANIGCMYGDLPTYDKLLQLVIYSQLIETKYNHTGLIISGGTSITLPLLVLGKVPQGVNHFRIGEAVFLGTSPFNNKKFLSLHEDCFVFEANILEIYRKESLPEKKRMKKLHRTKSALGEADNSSYKGLLDFGLIDASPNFLVPFDDTLSLYGSSSDLSVYDFGENPNGYKVGSKVKFSLKYMGLAQLMNSKHIEKRML